MLLLSLVSLISYANAVPTGKTDDVSQWLMSEAIPNTGVAYKGLLANIHPAGTTNGVVIASPSNQVNATDNNYFFHWKREYAVFVHSWFLVQH